MFYTITYVSTRLCYIEVSYFSFLRASRQRRHARGGLCKSNLSVPPPHQAGQFDAIAELPFGQLLGSHCVRVFARVQASDERGAARVAAADIESPADKGAILVGVQDNVGASVARDAVSSDLFLG